MRHIFVRITLFFLITMLSETSLVAGAKVTILLQNGKQITGELLAVRDTRFIIATDIEMHEEVLRAHPEKLLVVAKEDVRSFTICARSYIFNGIAVGLAGGIIIGMIVSYEPRGWETNKNNFDPEGAGPNALIFCTVGGSGAGGTCWGNRSYRGI